MPVSNPLPIHLRPCREKVFGEARGIPLDRNAKARIIAYAKGYNARMKQPGQHWGPITRAYMQVLEALLWGFHNSRDGRCFPSYESIAARARCNRDTVYEAIKALEFADILTWVNRITRIRQQIPDLFGKWSTVWRVIRTSNAYVFRDPLPCAENRPPEARASKSENPTGPLNQDISSNIQATAHDLSDMDSDLLTTLHRIGSAIAAKKALAVS